MYYQEKSSFKISNNYPSLIIFKNGMAKTIKKYMMILNYDFIIIFDIFFFYIIREFKWYL